MTQQIVLCWLLHTRMMKHESFKNFYLQTMWIRQHATKFIQHIYFIIFNKLNFYYFSYIYFNTCKLNEEIWCFANAYLHQRNKKKKYINAFVYKLPVYYIRKKIFWKIIAPKYLSRFLHSRLIFNCTLFITIYWHWYIVTRLHDIYICVIAI